MATDLHYHCFYAAYYGGPLPAELTKLTPLAAAWQHLDRSINQFINEGPTAT